jgi:fibronectin type 3 domain-containing protein
MTVEGEKLELDGPLSAAVRVDAEQQFPPAVPAGLAAVATAGEAGNPPAIDLSWQPNTDADLAGYAVYRRDVNAAGASGAADTWQRVSPAQPVVGPGFHDPNVEPGHSYAYAVTAIDQEGHESARSAEAEETVPGP